jgi:hypothetical protein
MGKEPEGKDLEFGQVREEIEAKQRATVWPDTLRNGLSVDAFLWKGDPHAKPVQRVGLIIFALTFLLLAFAMLSAFIAKRSEDGSFLGLLLSLGFLLLSVRLLRNAFLRSPKRHNREDD